jgi:hypothetical protein
MITGAAMSLGSVSVITNTLRLRTIDIGSSPLGAEDPRAAEALQLADPPVIPPARFDGEDKPPTPGSES